MDSLTHIVLGASIGEVIAGRKLGKKAMIWGAAAQSLPDIDFVATAWSNTPDYLLAHRGFTHSIAFSFMIAGVLALFARRWHYSSPFRFRNWFLFLFAELLMHIFIDAFNNYGTGWFEPFSHFRVSFNILYVVDPFFSIGPAISFLLLLFLRRPKRRYRWAGMGIIASAFYLLYCCANKIKIDSDVRDILDRQQISYTYYLTTPAPLNNWLWFIAAGSDSGFYVGYRSVFDSNKKMRFEYFPRKQYLLQNTPQTSAVAKLQRFSKGFYTVEKWTDTLVFNDLRFGQIAGWQSPHEHFAFHYFIDYPDQNKLVVQRGRYASLTGNSVQTLIERIRGN